jgi:hypothetical protein
MTLLILVKVMVRLVGSLARPGFRIALLSRDGVLFSK